MSLAPSPYPLVEKGISDLRTTCSSNGDGNNTTVSDAYYYLVVRSDLITPSSAIYYPFVVWVCGVLLFFLLKRFPNHYLEAIPYAAAMFLLGTAMGLGAELNTEADDLLTLSIHQWVRMDGNLLLLVFLPGLIFRDAIEVNLDLFVQSFSQLLVLAFPMVLLGTTLVAIVCVYVLVPYNFSWALGATLGSILSSTDPVAVAAVLAEAGAPPRLKMHIAGESMLNDGAALVFYTIFGQIYLSPLLGEEPLGAAEGVKMFFQASLGGLAMGIAFALGLVVLLYELDRRLDPEYDILQVVAAVAVAYMSYFVADLVNTSGVISCLFCGIGASWLGKGVINDLQLMDSFLKLMEHMLNSLLFALGGSIWGSILSSQHTTRIYPKDWGYLVAFYVIVLILRFLQVALFYPILSRIGLKTNIKEATFLSFGGLRGAVGIALASSLFRTVSVTDCSSDGHFLQDATRLVFLSGGISLGTLLVNGTLAGWMIRTLDLALPKTSRKTMQDMFEMAERKFVLQQYQELISEARFQHNVVDFRIVKAHVLILPEVEPAVPTADTTTTATTGSLDLGAASKVPPQIASIATSAVCTTDNCISDRVVQFRLVFLDMLKEAYALAVVRGELVNETNRALDASIFRQSVEFAESDAKRQPLNDWVALQIFDRDLHEDARTWMRGRGSGRSSYSSVNNNNSTTDGGDNTQKRTNAQYKKERQRLLRAFCFVDAHRRVCQRLQAYVHSVTDENDDNNDINDQEEAIDGGSSNNINGSNTGVTSLHDTSSVRQALQTVLEESKAEQDEARAVIDEFDEDQREIILSHYVATIILNRLVKKIEEAAHDGVLNKNEARSYIATIENEWLPNHHIDGRVCECLIEHHSRRSVMLQRQQQSHQD